MIKELLSIYETIDSDEHRYISPRTVYNDQQLLLLIFKWFRSMDQWIINSDSDRKIKTAFSSGSGTRYYMNATLSTPFQMKEGKKDILSEPNSLVHGVIGDFKIIYGKTKEKLVIKPNPRVFNVFQTTVVADLKKGPKNYSQVARNIACMIESLKEVTFKEIEKVGFYIIAPSLTLKRESFKNDTYKPTIEKSILDRLNLLPISDEKSLILACFEFVFPRIDVDCISFEDIIRFIKKNDVTYGEDIENFYTKTLEYHGGK